jgi:hypothetical protein
MGASQRGAPPAFQRLAPAIHPRRFIQRRSNVMTDPSRPAQSIQFAIEVEGVLDPRWEEWFSGLSVSVVPSGTNAKRTMLIATVPDQSALPAVLARVTGLNLKVVSVRPAGWAESK